MNTLDLDLGGATRAKRAEERSMPYPPNDWRYWMERGRREAEYERAVDAQLAAALRRLVAVYRQLRDTTAGYTSEEWAAVNAAMDAAWSEAFRVCPVDESEAK